MHSAILNVIQRKFWLVKEMMKSNRAFVSDPIASPKMTLTRIHKQQIINPLKTSF